MVLQRLDQRTATVIRLAGLVLIGWSVLTSDPGPGAGGRGLVVTVLFAAAIVAWLVWTVWPGIDRGLTAEVYVLAGAGGFLCGASPDSAASAFAFVAVITAGVRVELSRAWTVVAVAAAAVGGSVLIYNGGALTVLAYTLGFVAATLAASNARQSVARADQAELLLAQTQRSQEEQLRSARLEEATRIAREIHDVLAHTLAGLAIQLEATASLIEQGADREAMLTRVRRAHELAREGLRETRLAVGALRGDTTAAPAAIEALVADHRAATDAPAQLTIDGDRVRLAGPPGQTVLRVVQEALTNVRKHAPGAAVAVTVHAGSDAGDEIVVVVRDQPAHGAEPGHPPGWLADAGGGYGIQGMRERAEALGGTLAAGPSGAGWQVHLRLPDPAAARAGAGTGTAVPS
ncbi:MAG TPA: histidine kinase [Solirubrobacteraceae bacterium]|jgi:signal transduction histidine kinase|nr:histidine kinase [Solirubrobacteraceae bacterium]